MTPLSKEHCKDCCCARAWEALAVTTYTGMSIVEHIEQLRQQLVTAQQTLAAWEHRWHLAATHDAEVEKGAMTHEEDMAARRVASQAYIASLPKGTVEELQEQVLALRAELAQCGTLLYRIIHADERGQGVPFQEAMDDAQRYWQAKVTREEETP